MESVTISVEKLLFMCIILLLIYIPETQNLKKIKEHLTISDDILSRNCKIWVTMYFNGV